jgi:hypothetical protein
MATTYSSRIDPLPAIAIGALALGLPGSLAGALWFSRSRGDALVFALTAAFIAALLLIVVWPVRYTLDERALVIRFGVLRVHIAYDRIDEVAPTRTLLAAPALSRDRLQIRHRGGLAVISPREKERFLSDLVAHDPGLALEGDRVVRR